MSDLKNTTTLGNQIGSSTNPKGKKHSKKSRKNSPRDDARKQLFNEGKVGPIEQVQVSTERIVKLNGILLDLDPSLLKQSSLIPNLPADPYLFFEQRVKSWLGRHPILDSLEIRMSGTGLHGILWLEPAVGFVDDATRNRWCSIVQIIQAALPTDPHAPGITATTRALGSINTKSGTKVKRLKTGTPVSPEAAIELQQQIYSSPFKSLFFTMTGSDRMSPCPICSTEKTTLVALDYVGRCYKCGKVSFDKFCEQLYQSETSSQG